MFTAEMLKLACEKDFEVGPSTNGYLSVTGEPYVTIGRETVSFENRYEVINEEILGVVREGKEHEVAFDEETAYFLAYDSFYNYSELRKGILYWRNIPRLEWNKKKDRCVMYMRCLISEKPQILNEKG